MYNVEMVDKTCLLCQRVWGGGVISNKMLTLLMLESIGLGKPKSKENYTNNH